MQLSEVYVLSHVKRNYPLFRSSTLLKFAQTPSLRVAIRRREKFIKTKIRLRVVGRRTCNPVYTFFRWKHLNWWRYPQTYKIYVIISNQKRRTRNLMWGKITIWCSKHTFSYTCKVKYISFVVYFNFARRYTLHQIPLPCSEAKKIVYISSLWL